LPKAYGSQFVKLYSNEIVIKNVAVQWRIILNFYKKGSLGTPSKWILYGYKICLLLTEIAHELFYWLINV